jgi:hypothetical protein
MARFSQSELFWKLNVRTERKPAFSYGKGGRDGGRDSGRDNRWNGENRGGGGGGGGGGGYRDGPRR